jgi:hypothetical protein
MCPPAALRVLSLPGQRLLPDRQIARLLNRSEITLDAAAQTIGVRKMTALRMIRRGDLKGRQVCKGAPWVVKTEDVAAFGARKRSSGSITPKSCAADLSVSMR